MKAIWQNLHVILIIAQPAGGLCGKWMEPSGIRFPLVKIM